MTLLVRDARDEDLEEIVTAHVSAFPGFLLTLLGTRFLIAFYHAFLTDKDALLFVAEGSDRRVAGFLAGVIAPERYFGRLRLTRGLRLGFAALPALARHPLRVGRRLLAAAVYRGDRPPGLPEYWLLSSLGVHATASGMGAGGALMTRFLNSARQAGARGVYLLTDESGNAATLRFYDRHGFSVHVECTRPDGRRLLVLTRSLEP
jgi:ribosomal protein S18 acetylase RimI-like enzyme